ncbi:MAG: PAS domain-containing protein [Candidatus Competibacteraceae bacterium]|nr:PAS domain-containing protein [Candidatus Competibacteraceae bacterium]
MDSNPLPETVVLRRRYADLFDFAPVGYFVLASDGTILEVNPAGVALLGQDRCNLISQRFERFVAVATRPRFNTFLGQVLSSASRETCKIVLATQGLPRRYLHLAGAAVASATGQRCHVAVMHSTERYLAEDKAPTASQFLRSVVDSLPVHLAILDERGVILAVNARWKQFADENGLGDANYGLNQNYLAICDAAQGFRSAEAKATAAGIRAVLAWTTDQFILEYPCHAPDRRRWFLLRVTPFLGPGSARAIVLHVDITERKQAEELLQASSQRLKALSRRLLLVQEEERRTLARELHDDFGQQLTALKLNLGLLNNRSLDTVGHRRIADCLEIVNHTLERVRDTALNLRPSILDDLGLSAALHWYARRQAERAGCVIEVRDCVPPLSPDLETAVFRIVQEAVNNAIRHSAARTIDIAVEISHQRLLLAIRDDGTGFAPEEKPTEDRRGMGLMNMRERVELLGGQFALTSWQGGGTVIEAEIPLPEVFP